MKKIRIIIAIVWFVLYSYCLNAQSSKTNQWVAELKTAQDDTNKINLLYSIAKELLYSQPDEAMRYNKEAYILADSIKSMTHKAKCLDLNGIYHQNKGDYDAAELLYQQAFEIRRDMENPRYIAVSHNNFGVLYRKKGDYDKSEIHFVEALAISQIAKDSVSVSMITNNLGLLMENMGKYEESIDYHLKSLKIREKLKDSSAIASSLNNIGMVFIAMHKNDDALKYLYRSLDLKKKLNNQHSLASTYVNIGTVYFYQSKYSEALNNFDEGLEIYSNLGDKKNSAAVLSNMAAVSRKAKDYKSSVEYDLKSISIYESLTSYDMQLCNAYNSLCMSYFELNEYQKSLIYANKAVAIAEEKSLLPVLNVSYEWLYRIYKAKGIHHQALFYLELHTKVKDSLFNETSNKQVMELMTKYETQKKESQIALLNNENALKEVQLKNIRYKNTLLIVGLAALFLTFYMIFMYYRLNQRQKYTNIKQKLLRTQMNPHFIFNTISSIQNFIIRNKSLEAGAYLADFAKLMRAILDNSKVDFIRLSDEIEILTNYLRMHKINMENGLDFSIESKSAIDADEILIPPMLAQPFIENSIIHGIKPKPDGGFIKIVFQVDELKRALNIEITDNGIGRDKSKKQFGETHSSMATEIVSERLAMMKKNNPNKATLDITDIKGSMDGQTGTKVSISLPLVYSN